jgi:hypothetical protein
MAIKYINIFQSKALQNLPKVGTFGFKINHLATLQKSRMSGKNVKGLLGQIPARRRLDIESRVLKLRNDLWLG